MTSSQASGGGFLLPSLPSPTPSDASSVFSYRPLPHPRPSPLKPGSRPENSLIAFLDQELLQVSRKYAKKFNDGGYTDSAEIADDLEKLVDLLWVSATPSLQTPYLLQIANSFNDYISSFSPRFKSTLRLLDKLDRCFHSLITGSSTDSYAPLSPALSGHKMNMTERVRLKSVIERTRLHVVGLAEGIMQAPDPPTEDVPDVGDRESKNAQVDAVDEDPEEEDEALEIELSRVYERSLAEIGETLKREE
ncbi:hypothetical protein L873DRAFT_1809582 [Choiromyces venosus 120613-1]|uniref:Meiotic recombination protein DMC1 n=1 Tax=Choiromyces venosus 120613-1 TaxID=1336337 RepID=A0A3N4JV09_9PEZI|nr:hypothetical protein L873DRAFT_1809582 [Choiromyces venosus 120613-1]